MARNTVLVTADAGVRESNVELVLSSPAWHPRLDPGLQRFDELLV